MFAKDNGVIQGHRLQEHAVSVLDGGRRHHDQSGIMRVEALQVLTVKRPGAGSAAGRQPNGDRARHLRAPKKRRRLIDDLIQPRRGKIRVLHFDDGPHPFDGRADGRPHHRVLADGRVQHAAGKVPGQILGRLEGAAESADILSVNKNTRIVSQGFGLSGADGFQVGNAHGCGAGARSLKTSDKCREESAHQFSL